MESINNKNLCILEQSTESFESVEEKNRFIGNSEAEWIGFVDGDITSKEEVCQILKDAPFLMDYDAILMGENVPEGECDVLELLAHPTSTVYALFFRKKLLIYTGAYNRFLSGNSNYEFLLRLAERGRVYSIPCSAEKNVEFNSMTMAYVIRRYMEKLKEYGKLDEVFVRFLGAAESQGRAVDFIEIMNNFLNDAEKYEQIYDDTTSILIMVTNDLEYYGVLDGFANALADELVKMGQAVITTNDRYGGYQVLPKEVLLTQRYKAIMGFQSPALQSKNFQNMKGKRYQFWLDDPMYSVEFFKNTPKQTHILCQDANYAAFLRNHLNLEKAEQFPPAGEMAEGKHQNIYDLVFLGSYISVPRARYDNVFRQELYEYMMHHTDATVEQGIKSVWKKYEVAYDEEVFMQTLESVRDICYDLLQIYRHRVVETILNAGIQLHVFGDSWKAYQGRGCENLIIHPKVDAKEALQVWAQSTIGLNIMNGHKAGMTERVANIMLSGACCLSDETSYLKEHFQDGKDIVLYRGNELEQLPAKIRYLLEHDEEREKIASAGRERAYREHTWKRRAEELLEMINAEIAGER